MSLRSPSPTAGTSLSLPAAAETRPPSPADPAAAAEPSNLQHTHTRSITIHGVIFCLLDAGFESEAGQAEGFYLIVGFHVLLELSVHKECNYI